MVTKRLSTYDLNYRILSRRLLVKGIHRDDIQAKLDKGFSMSEIYRNARANMAFSGI